MSNDAIEILENVFWTLVGTVRYYIARKMQRLRITFTKSEEARFIGNLDLHRAWERTMRRVGADMVFSQGFNPSPKLQLASALPLGITSEAEVLDVWLNERVEIDDFGVQITEVLPPGIQIRKIREAKLGEKSLQSRLCAVEYVVEMRDSKLIREIELEVKKLLSRQTVMRKRRGKDYDLRPLIETLEVKRDKPGNADLHMRLSARPGFTGRPEEVISALGMALTWMHRTALIFIDKDY